MSDQKIKTCITPKGSRYGTLVSPGRVLVPSYKSSWNRGVHGAPKVKRTEKEVDQVNDATETSQTEVGHRQSGWQDFWKLMGWLIATEVGGR